MIDLHAHTTASDGTVTPRQLVTQAHELGLSAIGITDHDTIAGWDEAIETGRELGISVVPGIELSVESSLGRFHLLGYGMSKNAPLLTQILPEIQSARANRNELIIEKLNSLGHKISIQEVKKVAGEAQIGRPHIAQVLVEDKSNALGTIQQVFDELLAAGKPAHLPKKVLSPQAAIKGIHDAGGVAIWAHPPFDRKERSWEEYEAILQQWISWGLDGLETFYFTYTSEETEWTVRMAEKYGLLQSGGSDFHGARKVNPLGITQTGEGVPDDILDEIKSRLKTNEGRK